MTEPIYLYKKGVVWMPSIKDPDRYPQIGDRVRLLKCSGYLEGCEAIVNGFTSGGRFTVDINTCNRRTVLGPVWGNLPRSYWEIVE